MKKQNKGSHNHILHSFSKKKKKNTDLGKYLNLQHLKKVTTEYKNLKDFLTHSTDEPNHSPYELSI